ncbi:hypothetical protein JAAARDRAFT_332238 [Jaapia argillacea MUCL 33604]|uniref:Uncharacterized protein n=1 Tax=Jaapia argillacea MUCL 33604 TaxID=933084 RepID=A0A067PZW1_9AGAM|nr:hypothetical protein JAAARDRAFT_332238 [Jaapia argillacea MUCL 33604]
MFSSLRKSKKKHRQNLLPTTCPNGQFNPRLRNILSRPALKSQNPRWRRKRFYPRRRRNYPPAWTLKRRCSNGNGVKNGFLNGNNWWQYAHIPADKAEELRKLLSISIARPLPSIVPESVDASTIALPSPGGDKPITVDSPQTPVTPPKRRGVLDLPSSSPVPELSPKEPRQTTPSKSEWVPSDVEDANAMDCDLPEPDSESALEEDRRKHLSHRYRKLVDEAVPNSLAPDAIGDEDISMPAQHGTDTSRTTAPTPGQGPDLLAPISSLPTAVPLESPLRTAELKSEPISSNVCVATPLTLAAPTPAQRPRVRQSSPPIFHSSRQRSPPQISHQSHPSSSPQLVSSSQPIFPISTRKIPPRKVPRPPPPSFPPGGATGPGRILVPNSDTSGTASQGQSQSQSQSQGDDRSNMLQSLYSQRYPASQASSQPQAPSQLPLPEDTSKPVRAGTNRRPQDPPDTEYDGDLSQPQSPRVSQDQDQASPPEAPLQVSEIKSVNSIHTRGETLEDALVIVQGPAEALNESIEMVTGHGPIEIEEQVPAPPPSKRLRAIKAIADTLSADDEATVSALEKSTKQQGSVRSGDAPQHTPVLLLRRIGPTLVLPGPLL